MRGQNQIDEQQRQREDEETGAASQNLLVGQIRPLEGDAGRQGFLCDPFNGSLRLTGRETGGRIAVDIGGKEAVIADGAFRTHGLLHLQKCRQRDHFPRLRTHFQLPDILGMAAIIRIGLNAHTVGASEGIEVVDIKRTQIDLQGFKHVGHGHAKLTGLHAVQIGIKLRHVDLVA